MSKFRYPSDLVGPLRASWKEWRRQELDPPELPDDTWLATVLETAYHAGFTLEEQRRTRFSAVICSPEEASDPLLFARPRAFSAHELMRLAPVAAAREVLVGITYAGPDAPPEIWGLCSDAFMQLTVSVFGPGTLEVGRNGYSLVALRGGQLDEGSNGGAFGVISDYVTDANATIWNGVNFSGGSWSPELVVYPQYFLTLASNVARAGHGGAILVIRDSDAVSFLGSDMARIKYACDDNSLWDTALVAIRGFDEQTFSDDRKRLETEIAETKVSKLLERLAALASVDGAVLITDRLRLLGFGTEVTASAKLDMVETIDGRAMPVDSFGTRHRSAFRFSSAYPSGLAVVCSQDGGIRCIQWLDGKLRLSEW